MYAVYKNRKTRLRNNQDEDTRTSRIQLRPPTVCRSNRDLYCGHDRRSSTTLVRTPASQPLPLLSALGSGSRRRRGTDRSRAHSHQRRNLCRKGWILRGRAGDARRQFEENIHTFQASDILNAFFLLLLRTQHEKRVVYFSRASPILATAVGTLHFNIHPGSSRCS
ncbi:hypothetical protein B0H13DRAFT_2115290 [Mycena leptocephala]|nr:hypothetical protein B0H13DRAFT_2115290 [Mycena leptocephala]